LVDGIEKKVIVVKKKNKKRGNKGFFTLITQNIRSDAASRGTRTSMHLCINRDKPTLKKGFILFLPTVHTQI
jgi:hypothetical protein